MVHWYIGTLLQATTTTRNSMEKYVSLIRDKALYLSSKNIVNQDNSHSESVTAILFVLQLDHHWLNNEFHLEHALQTLPLKQQLRIKNKRFYLDKCLSLGNQLLQVFATVAVSKLVEQDSSKHNETDESFSTHDIITGFHHNANGKPFFHNDKILNSSKFQYLFNLSNDKESLINSMITIISAKDINIQPDPKHHRKHNIQISSNLSPTSQTMAIGIDLINVDLLSPDFIDELKLEIMHPSELAFFNSLAETSPHTTSTNSPKNTISEKQKRIFAQIWSLKEAYSKYIGTGLVGLDLKLLEFREIKVLCYDDGRRAVNDEVELFIDGVRQLDQHQDELTIVTKLINERVFYSVIVGNGRSAKDGKIVHGGNDYDSNRTSHERRKKKELNVVEVPVELKEMTEILSSLDG